MQALWPATFGRENRTRPDDRVLSLPRLTFPGLVCVITEAWLKSCVVASDLTIAEIRQSLENEKLNLLEEARRKAEGDKKRAVDDTKRRQWCANCQKEAMFFCCWNTSYCGYNCQQLHWPKHMATCTQARELAPTTETTDAKQDNTQPEIPHELKSTHTPSSPMETSLPTNEPKTKAADNDDDSDNDDMVIDEGSLKDDADQKTVSIQSVDLTSPASPEVSTAANNVEKKDISPPATTVASTVAVSSNIAGHSAISRSSFPEVKAVSLPTTTTASNLSGDVKSKQLSSKAPSNNGSAAAAASANVVPSKLLDDIFFKVLSKDSRSDAKNSPTERTETVAQTSSSDQPTTAAISKPEPKHASSGSAISAISDRLLKARQQPPAAPVDSGGGDAESAAAPTIPTKNVSSSPTQPSQETAVTALPLSVADTSVGKSEKAADKPDEAVDAEQGSGSAEFNTGKPVHVSDTPVSEHLPHKSPPKPGGRTDADDKPAPSDAASLEPSEATASSSEDRVDGERRKSASLSVSGCTTVTERDAVASKEPVGIGENASQGKARLSLTCEQDSAKEDKASEPRSTEKDLETKSDCDVGHGSLVEPSLKSVDDSGLASNNTTATASDNVTWFWFETRNVL